MESMISDGHDGLDPARLPVRVLTLATCIREGDIIVVPHRDGTTFTSTVVLSTHKRGDMVGLTVSALPVTLYVDKNENLEILSATRTVRASCGIRGCNYEESVQHTLGDFISTPLANSDVPVVLLDLGRPDTDMAIQILCPECMLTYPALEKRDTAWPGTDTQHTDRRDADNAYLD